MIKGHFCLTNHFLKTILSHITIKELKLEKINLIDKGNVISGDQEICSISIVFFSNKMSNLNIPAIVHSHANLRNTDPIVGLVDSYDK